MTVKITQMCDNCGRDRSLDGLGKIGNTQTLEELENSEGWRKVRENKHLCKVCINGLVQN
jgi:hypothetical protein